MKSFSALLWRSSGDEMRDPNPVVGALGLDKLQEVKVFGLRPWSPLVTTHLKNM